MRVSVREFRAKMAEYMKNEVEVESRGKVLGRWVPASKLEEKASEEPSNVHEGDYLTPEKRAGLEKMRALLSNPEPTEPEIEEPEEVRYVWNEVLGEMSPVSKEDIQRVYGKGWENKWRKLSLSAG